jgi:subtilase family serine protease
MAILERLAAAGISVQFASGDSGDQGLGTPLGAVSIPSNSPYATAVGGTSVLNDPLSNGDIVTGWGTNLTALQIVTVADPPATIGFQYGAGGGESQFFAKPKWQKALPGNGRQVPDVSADADPFTGVPVVETTSGIEPYMCFFHIKYSISACSRRMPGSASVKSAVSRSICRSLEGAS